MDARIHPSSQWAAFTMIFAVAFLVLPLLSISYVFRQWWFEPSPYVAYYGVPGSSQKTTRYPTQRAFLRALLPFIESHYDAKAWLPSPDDRPSGASNFGGDLSVGQYRLDIGEFADMPAASQQFRGLYAPWPPQVFGIEEQVESRDEATRDVLERRIRLMNPEESYEGAFTAAELWTSGAWLICVRGSPSASTRVAALADEIRRQLRRYHLPKHVLGVADIEADESRDWAQFSWATQDGLISLGGPPMQAIAAAAAMAPVQRNEYLKY